MGRAEELPRFIMWSPAADYMEGKEPVRGVRGVPVEAVQPLLGYLGARGVRVRRLRGTAARLLSAEQGMALWGKTQDIQRPVILAAEAAAAELVRRVILAREAAQENMLNFLFQTPRRRINM